MLFNYNLEKQTNYLFNIAFCYVLCLLEIKGQISLYNKKLPRKIFESKVFKLQRRNSSTAININHLQRCVPDLNSIDLFCQDRLQAHYRDLH